jgi:DNA mismatch repair ATPase MutS
MSNKSNIRKEIKDSLKNDFNFDLVLVQIGFMFEAIEEDAIFLEEKFNCQLQGQGQGQGDFNTLFDITGFPLKSLDKYKEQLDSMNINYCLVEQIGGRQKGKVTRRVTFSTIEGSEGLMF